jgi:hypothetical protein
MKNSRLLLVFITCSTFTACTAKFSTCIEDADQSKAEIKIERIDPAKDTFYEQVFISDNAKQTWSQFLPEILEKKLKGRTNTNIQGKYSFEKIDTAHFRYILNSTANEDISPNMIVTAIMFKNENTTFIMLAYYNRKHYCKSLAKTNFFAERKRRLPKRMHEKIKIKHKNKFRTKKEILLIIQNGKVEKVDLKPTPGV